MPNMIQLFPPYIYNIHMSGGCFTFVLDCIPCGTDFPQKDGCIHDLPQAALGRPRRTRTCLIRSGSIRRRRRDHRSLRSEEIFGGRQAGCRRARNWRFLTSSLQEEQPGAWATSFKEACLLIYIWLKKYILHRYIYIYTYIYRLHISYVIYIYIKCNIYIYIIH